MLWSSWHNHTGDGPRFSYCAERELTPDSYRGLLMTGPWEAFAITDHAFALALPNEEAWPHQWYHTPERLWARPAFREDKTARYLDRLARVTDGERIFGGLEVEVACDGSLSMEPALWPHLDVVVGAIHYLPGERGEWPERHLEQLDMLLQYPIDILAHPFRQVAQAGPVPDELIDETLRRALRAGVAVEINAHIPYEGDAEVLARAARMGLQVAFGLDAHHPRELYLHTYFERVVADSQRSQTYSGLRAEEMRLFQPVRKTPEPRAELARDPG